MEVKIPKRDWFVYATIYKTLVKCPKCGNTRYADISHYGDEWKKEFKCSWVEEDKNWSQFTCDLCGETIVAYMTDDEEKKEKFKYKLGNYYKVRVKDDKSSYKDIPYAFIEMYKPFSYFGDIEVPDKWWRVILTLHTDREGMIVHCGTREDCEKYLDEHFEVLEDLKTPALMNDVFLNFDEEDDTPTHGIVIQPNTWYDVNVMNYTNQEIVPKDSIRVIISKKREDSNCCDMVVMMADGWRKTIEHCADWEICLDILLTYFEVVKVSEKQDYPLGAERLSL